MIEILKQSPYDTDGLELLRPNEIEKGMRIGRRRGEEFLLIPVWGVSVLPGLRHLFTLSTGERASALMADRVWVQPGVSFPPPVDATWITNDKFGTSFDILFMDRSRPTQSFTHSKTGDLYELRHGRSRPGEEFWDAMRVLRTTPSGERWWAPARFTLEGPLEQWDEITEGRGW